MGNNSGNQNQKKVNIFKEKIYSSGYQNIQKLRRYLISILNEKHNRFLWYLVFFWAKMDPKPKDQEVRGHVSTTFLEALQCGPAYGSTYLINFADIKNLLCRVMSLLFKSN